MICQENLLQIIINFFFNMINMNTILKWINAKRKIRPSFIYLVIHSNLDILINIFLNFKTINIWWIHECLYENGFLSNLIVSFYDCWIFYLRSQQASDKNEHVTVLPTTKLWITFWLATFTFVQALQSKGRERTLGRTIVSKISRLTSFNIF